MPSLRSHLADYLTSSSLSKETIQSHLGNGTFTEQADGSVWFTFDEATEAHPVEVMRNDSIIIQGTLNTHFPHTPITRSEDPIALIFPQELVTAIERYCQFPRLSFKTKELLNALHPEVVAMILTGQGREAKIYFEELRATLHSISHLFLEHSIVNKVDSCHPDPFIRVKDVKEAIRKSLSEMQASLSSIKYKYDNSGSVWEVLPPGSRQSRQRFDKTDKSPSPWQTRVEDTIKKLTAIVEEGPRLLEKLSQLESAWARFQHPIPPEQQGEAAALFQAIPETYKEIELWNFAYIKSSDDIRKSYQILRDPNERAYRGPSSGRGMRGAACDGDEDNATTTAIDLQKMLFQGGMVTTSEVPASEMQGTFATSQAELIEFIKYRFGSYANPVETFLADALVLMSHAYSKVSQQTGWYPLASATLNSIFSPNFSKLLKNTGPFKKPEAFARDIQKINDQRTQAALAKGESTPPPLSIRPIAPESPFVSVRYRSHHRGPEKFSSTLVCEFLPFAGLEAASPIVGIEASFLNKDKLVNMDLLSFYVSTRLGYQTLKEVLTNPHRYFPDDFPEGVSLLLPSEQSFDTTLSVNMYPNAGDAPVRFSSRRLVPADDSSYRLLELVIRPEGIHMVIHNPGQSQTVNPMVDGKMHLDEIRVKTRNRHCKDMAEANKAYKLYKLFLESGEPSFIQFLKGRDIDAPFKVERMVKEKLSTLNATRLPAEITGHLCLPIDPKILKRVEGPIKLSLTSHMVMSTPIKHHDICGALATIVAEVEELERISNDLKNIDSPKSLITEILMNKERRRQGRGYRGDAYFLAMIAPLTPIRTTSLSKEELGERVNRYFELVAKLQVYQREGTVRKLIEEFHRAANESNEHIVHQAYAAMQMMEAQFSPSPRAETVREPSPEGRPLLEELTTFYSTLIDENADFTLLEAKANQLRAFFPRCALDNFLTQLMDKGQFRDLFICRYIIEAIQGAEAQADQVTYWQTIRAQLHTISEEEVESPSDTMSEDEINNVKEVYTLLDTTKEGRDFLQAQHYPVFPSIENINPETQNPFSKAECLAAWQTIALIFASHEAEVVLLGKQALSSTGIATNPVERTTPTAASPSRFFSGTTVPPTTSDLGLPCTL